MPLKTISLQLDEDLLAEVDRVRGGVPRQRWFAEAARVALGVAGAVPESRGPAAELGRADREVVAASQPQTTSTVPPRRTSISVPSAADLMVERQRRLNETRAGRR